MVSNDASSCFRDTKSITIKKALETNSTIFGDAVGLSNMLRHHTSMRQRALDVAYRPLGSWMQNRIFRCLPFTSVSFPKSPVLGRVTVDCGIALYLILMLERVPKYALQAYVPW
jgi:hypothetical protein